MSDVRARLAALADAWPVTLQDVADLAASSIPDPEQLLDTLYTRRYEQLVLRARAVAGFGAGLLVALVVAAVIPSEETVLSLGLIAPALIASLVVLGSGIALHGAASRVQRELILARSVLARLRAQPSVAEAVGERSP